MRFARWSVACEAFAPGAFIAAFEQSEAEANEAVAEGDPVVVAVAAFVLARDFWRGTAASLLQILGNHDRTEAQPSAWKTWPREPSSFGKRLRLATPVLRKMHVGVLIGRASDHGRTRTITLTRIEPSERPQQATKPDTSDGSDSSDTSDTSRAVTKVAYFHGNFVYSKDGGRNDVRIVGAVRPVRPVRDPPLMFHRFLPCKRWIVAERAERAADFAVLCANCHRMIHHTDDPRNLALFRANLAEPKRLSGLGIRIRIMTSYGTSAIDNVRDALESEYRVGRRPRPLRPSSCPWCCRSID